MFPANDANQIVLPSGRRKRAIGTRLMFGRRTIRIVYIGSNVIAVSLVLWSMLTRSALLTAVPPDFRAAAIGIGVFFATLVAAIQREAWLLGAGGKRAPRGFAAALAMIALVIAGGFGGDFVATRLWEWRAFHGDRAEGVDRTLTVAARTHGRSGDTLELRSEAGPPFTIGCSREMYLATQLGERIILRVETGRRGVQRVRLPLSRDLRRA